MGTRADFWIGVGPDAEWLGSIAFDGYPNSRSGEPVPNDELAEVLRAETPDEYRRAVASRLGQGDDCSTPEMGWPWPWDDSSATDFAYTFTEGVYVSCFGSSWIPAERAITFDEWDDKLPTLWLPNMASCRVVARPGSSRSGFMVIAAPMSNPNYPQGGA